MQSEHMSQSRTGQRMPEPSNWEELDDYENMISEH